jgi:hypothetical protein
MYSKLLAAALAAMRLSGLVPRSQTNMDDRHLAWHKLPGHGRSSLLVLVRPTALRLWPVCHLIACIAAGSPLRLGTFLGLFVSFWSFYFITA